jgi:hypothetical protein
MSKISATAPDPFVTQFSPTFSATGLTFTGTDTTYPTYDSSYVKHGKLVSFVIKVDLSTVTNFGTGQYKLQLPFVPLVGYNHFSGWVHPNITVPADDSNHIILNVDTAGVTDILDLHYLVLSPANPKPVIENQFSQGNPYTLTTNSRIYVNGSYICQ